MELLLNCAEFCDAAYYINEFDKVNESPQLKQKYDIENFRSWDRHGNRAISFTTKKVNITSLIDDKFSSETTVVVAFRGTSNYSETFEDLKSYKKYPLCSGMSDERNITADGSGTALTALYNVFFKMVQDSLPSCLFFGLMSAYNNRRINIKVAM